MAQNAPAPVTRALPSLPEFSYDVNWITLVDRIITDANITANSTKFLLLFKSLPPEIQSDNSALLTSNAATTYADLVQALQDRLQLPAHKKFENLFSIEPIGDRNPRMFLRQLRNKYAASGGITDENLRYAYAWGLPQQYRIVALTTDPNRLDDAAKKIEDMWYTEKAMRGGANNLFNQCPVSSATLNQHQCTSCNSLQTPQLTRLIEENLQLKTELSMTDKKIRKLEDDVKKLAQGPAQKNNHSGTKYIPPHQRNYAVSCPPLPTFNSRGGLCFFHSQFGNNAYKCSAPCAIEEFRGHRCSNACPWPRFLEHGLRGPKASKN